MLKTYSFVITILYSIALATVCLVPINDIIKVEISFGDKIFHSLAYIVLTALWYTAFFFKFHYSKKKALLYAIIVSIVFGIIIEILQGTVTRYRSSDINDVFANTIGVLLAAVVIEIKNKYILK